MLEQSHPKCLDAGIEIAIKNDTHSGVCEDIKTKRLDSVSTSSVDSVEEEDYSWDRFRDNVCYGPFHGGQEQQKLL